MFLVIFWFVGLISAQNICENSPLNVVDLHGILATALKSLAKIRNGLANEYIPNLIVGETILNLKKPCNRTLGQVENCGYPFVFAKPNRPGEGQSANTWQFVPNPSVAYSGALVNQTKILHPNDPISFSDVAFTIDFSEAVIWFGCTPRVTYYAYSKLIWSLKPPATDVTSQILGAIGDTLNNYNLKSARVDTTIPGGGATLIVYTASKVTYDAISKAFVDAGFPADAINVDPFPTNEVDLGDTGATWGVGVRSSNLSAAEQSYIFDPDVGYFSQCQVNFPYVRLTPVIKHQENLLHPSIAPLSEWKPKVDQTNIVPPPSAFMQSELSYESYLWDVVLELVKALRNPQILAPPPGLKFKISLQTATYFEEFGELYIFEKKYHMKGADGTRDNNYFFYTPGIIPKYGPTNISIIVGLRHDSPNWSHFGKPSPHALFWNIVYSDSSFLGVLGNAIKGEDTNLHSFNSLNQQLLGAAQDPANLIWARVVGGADDTIQPLQNALHSLGFQIPNDASLQGVYPLIALHRAYVNPDTGVAPWLGSLLTPVQIHIVASPALCDETSGLCPL